jgi:hypothetical protein
MSIMLKKAMSVTVKVSFVVVVVVVVGSRLTLLFSATRTTLIMVDLFVL